jgi:hypothetical protein
MPGLDPGIHADLQFGMDHRVKPGGDGGRPRAADRAALKLQIGLALELLGRSMMYPARITPRCTYHTVYRFFLRFFCLTFVDRSLGLVPAG